MKQWKKTPRVRSRRGGAALTPEIIHGKGDGGSYNRSPACLWPGSKAKTKPTTEVRRNLGAPCFRAYVSNIERGGNSSCRKPLAKHAVHHRPEEVCTTVGRRAGKSWLVRQWLKDADVTYPMSRLRGRCDVTTRPGRGCGQCRAGRDRASRWIEKRGR